MKTRQVLKLDANGRKFTILYHEGVNNPYWIYRHTWSPRQDGCGYSERKRIEVKYEDIQSCLFHLAFSI